MAIFIDDSCVYDVFSGRQTSAMSEVAIGIDLGTTNSCVAVLKDGKVEIIPNDIGSRITPSCVAFDELDVHIGQAAKDQACVNFSNTVFENKRLIGCKFTDTAVQKDIKQWPFQVIDDNGAPVIRVQYKNTPLVYTPEQISAVVLEKLKRVADKFVGHEVQDAVITVPAYFNDSQRQATIDAGKIAGLKVLSIINEPTAAALAYGFHKKVVLDQTILVFDLGGGTFDVSILNIAGNDYVVKAVSGDTHLGGGDFDARIKEYFLDKIRKKCNKDISQKPKSLAKLKKACENAKITLSYASVAKINVECLIGDEDFRENLSRSQFERMCMDLFQKTIEHVKSALDDAGMNKSDINEVILVGGSTRIPKIQQLLSEFFDGKKLNSTINPDEAVAYGAAVKAALVSGEHTMEEITLADVVPLSLGRSKIGGDMVTFIKKNTRYPVTVIQNNWTTVSDYQTTNKVDIYEGERKLAKDNHFLGTFSFDVGERELKGVPKQTYTFTVDENGILHVSGVNEKSQTSGGITIISNKGRLEKEEIERMVEEAKQINIR